MKAFPFSKNHWDIIIFTIIKIIFNRTNKSERESGCYIFANIRLNFNFKIRSSFLSSVQFTYNNIAFVSHWDFWCPMYRKMFLLCTWVVIFSLFGIIFVLRNLIRSNSILLLCLEKQAIWVSTHAWEVHSTRDVNEGSTESKRRKQERSILFLFFLYSLFSSCQTKKI